MTNISKTAVDNTLKGINVDKRKHYVCVLDVETTSVKKGDFGKPLIYDLGFAITDRKGNIVYKRSLLIKEILCSGVLMVNAYYAEKLTKYLEDLANGVHELVSWNEALDVLGQALGHFGVKTISAYNWTFDRRALKATHSYLNGEELVIDIEKELCLWSLACETIFSQKSYAQIALDNGWLTGKGNLLTNAEVCYRYITGRYEFEEDHTGLSDVLIEVHIMQHALRQKKKIKSGVLGSPWHIPNKVHKDKKEAHFQAQAVAKQQAEAIAQATPLIVQLDLEM